MLTYESLAAEALAKWPQIDPDRMARAVEIASKPTTIYNSRLPRGQFDVRSSNGKGWYRVDTRHKTCTCQDSMRGHICKHRLAVWLHIEARTRPQAEARRVDQSVILQELGYV